MNKDRRISVIATIFHPEQQKVLLIKRRDVPIWVLPGGGADAGETPEEAVIREVFEETGLQVEISRLVSHYKPINRLANDTYVYECRYLAGHPSIGNETQDVGFFPLSQLPKPFFFLHGEWLQDALQRLPETIVKPLDQVTYLNLCKYFCLHPMQVLRLLLSRLGIPINS